MKTIEGFKLRDVMGYPTVVGEGINQIDFNKLISFNDSAAWLWREVEGKEFTATDLANLLSERYDVDPAKAARDASYIATEWMKNGLVKE